VEYENGLRKLRYVDYAVFMGIMNTNFPGASSNCLHRASHLGLARLAPTKAGDQIPGAPHPGIPSVVGSFLSEKPAF
jgi:hypothetical protein